MKARIKQMHSLLPICTTCLIIVVVSGLLMKISGCIPLIHCPPWFEEKPLSANEALSYNVGLPAYGIDPSASEYADLDAIYFYSGLDTSDSIRITAYFTYRDAEGKNVRVARLSHCNLCGPVMKDADTPAWTGDIVFKWIGLEVNGYTCEPSSSRYQRDDIQGSEYLSCLQWWDEQHNLTLYTVWPERQALEFAELLVLVNPETDAISNSP